MGEATAVLAGEEVAVVVVVHDECAGEGELPFDGGGRGEVEVHGVGDEFVVVAAGVLGGGHDHDDDDDDDGGGGGVGVRAGVVGTVHDDVLGKALDKSVAAAVVVWLVDGTAAVDIGATGDPRAVLGPSRFVGGLSTHTRRPFRFVQNRSTCEPSRISAIANQRETQARGHGGDAGG